MFGAALLCNDLLLFLQKCKHFEKGKDFTPFPIESICNRWLEPLNGLARWTHNRHWCVTLMLQAAAHMQSCLHVAMPHVGQIRLLCAAQ